MNSKKIFEIALGLGEPWHISSVRFEERGDRYRLNIDIDYSSGYFVDEAGKSTVHDRRDKTWRHLNLFQHECYINCRVPRIKDNQTGKVKQVEVPWARTGSGFTLLFEAYIMCLIEQGMPVNKAGKLVGEYPNRLWTIFNYWIGIAYNDADHSDVTTLEIDETSSKRGHDYVTVAVDMESDAVLHATEGKGADTITQIADYLNDKGSDRATIQKVCIDRSISLIYKWSDKGI